MLTPRHLKELLDQGRNINAALREAQGIQYNTEEIIEISYDLQAGSYSSAMEDPKVSQLKGAYAGEIAKTILSLCRPATVLEAGVGEATTLSTVLEKLGTGVDGYGFDLSWSRVALAKRWLARHRLHETTLCTGSLHHIPFADNSIDVVYTSHSIEPNGGSEEPILREMFRVARAFVVLLEPAYELVEESIRRRMDSHGYCRNLAGISKALGHEVLEHRLFPFNSNPLNPTALTVIRKKDPQPASSHILACPRFKTPLQELEGMLYSPEAMVAYPILGGIPCLRIENGVFSSKYPEVMAGR